jgi:hypothetical protein
MSSPRGFVEGGMGARGTPCRVGERAGEREGGRMRVTGSLSDGEEGEGGGVSRSFSSGECERADRSGDEEGEEMGETGLDGSERPKSERRMRGRGSRELRGGRRTLRYMFIVRSCLLACGT